MSKEKTPLITEIAALPGDEVLAKFDQEPRRHKRYKSREVQMIKTGISVGRGDGKQVIDPEEVYKLARIGSTITEIADWFSSNSQTIAYNFGSEISKGRSELKQNIRRVQIREALAGNVTMLVWLGKNVLKQTDKYEVDQTITTSEDVERIDDVDLIEQLKHLASKATVQ